jgi:hypothetical protein
VVVKFTFEEAQVITKALGEYHRVLKEAAEDNHGSIVGAILQERLQDADFHVPRIGAKLRELTE